jgi:DNA-binding IclR family transcriptional regulator
MGAKRSAEMKEALRLHEAGVNAHAAARQAGVLPSSFYRLLGKLKREAVLAVPARPHDASQ